VLRLASQFSVSHSVSHIKIPYENKDEV
jgi:hypothetical protein